MMLLLNIPKEFVCDWDKDKFEEFFDRVSVDLKDISPRLAVCGNYEYETLDMLAEAFKNAEEVEYTQ